jgi:hypothetical protein
MRVTLHRRTSKGGLFLPLVNKRWNPFSCYLDQYATCVEPDFKREYSDQIVYCSQDHVFICKNALQLLDRR